MYDADDVAYDVAYDAAYGGPLSTGRTYQIPCKYFKEQSASLNQINNLQPHPVS